jgi:hypothetical protein
MGIDLRVDVSCRGGSTDCAEGKGVTVRWVWRKPKAKLQLEEHEPDRRP